VECLWTRDKQEARLVCQDWNEFLRQSVLVEEVVVKVEHTEEVLKTLVELPLTSGNWGSYSFSNLELTRSSLDFWTAYGDIITSIDFNDCSITPHPHNTIDEGEVRVSLMTKLG
jgi:predicted DNA binding protein